MPDDDRWPPPTSENGAGEDDTGRVRRGAGPGGESLDDAAAGARDQMEGARSSLRRELRKLERVMAHERRPGDAEPRA